MCQPRTLTGARTPETLAVRCLLRSAAQSRSVRRLSGRCPVWTTCPSHLAIPAPSPTWRCETVAVRRNARSPSSTSGSADAAIGNDRTITFPRTSRTTRQRSDQQPTIPGRPARMDDATPGKVDHHTSGRERSESGRACHALLAAQIARRRLGCQSGRNSYRRQDSPTPSLECSDSLLPSGSAAVCSAGCREARPPSNKSPARGGASDYAYWCRSILGSGFFNLREKIVFRSAREPVETLMT